MGFLLRFVVLLLLFVACSGLLEWRYQDHVNYIDRLFERIDEAATGTSVLWVGNSHIGVVGEPQWRDAPTCNASIGGQDLFHSQALVAYAVERLDSLKTIVLGVDGNQLGLRSRTSQPTLS